jgi:hypothetical protein
VHVGGDAKLGAVAGKTFLAGSRGRDHTPNDDGDIMILKRGDSFAQSDPPTLLECEQYGQDLLESQSELGPVPGGWPCFRKYLDGKPEHNLSTCVASRKRVTLIQPDPLTTAEGLVDPVSPAGPIR